MKKIILFILEIIFHVLPVSKNKAYFRAFGGMYADNPKYISEKLHELAPDIEIYWELQRGSDLTDIPDYINVVLQDSYFRPFYKNRCKIIVETGAGYYLAYIPNRIKFTIEKLLLNNKRQYNMSTWHGTPLKYIGAQIRGNEKWTKFNVFTTSNCILSGSRYLTEILHKAFVGIAPIYEFGTPRTDILFKQTLESNNEVKIKLGLPVDKNIILYAPTFRDYSLQDSGIEQLKMLDFDKLFKVLNERFGGNWAFVMRAHPMIKNEINQYIYNLENENVINGNRHQDMMEYLAASDILLSDYSSSVFDYALSGRRCMLFAHDKESYVSEDRGLYEDMSILPFSFSNSFEELINNILNYDDEVEEKKVHDFLLNIGCIEDGHAAERCVNHLLRSIEYES